MNPRPFFAAGMDFSSLNLENATWRQWRGIMACGKLLTLFHVSPVRHRQGIVRWGLLPCADRRGKGRIWLCDRRRLPWALEHVARTHRIAQDELQVWKVTVDPQAVSRRRLGVYYSVLRLRARPAVASI